LSWLAQPSSRRSPYLGDADLVVVGRQGRQSARARTDRLLLDTAGAVIATPRRKVIARARDRLDRRRPRGLAERGQELAEPCRPAGAGERIAPILSF
jgi:hypothetical protein